MIIELAKGHFGSLSKNVPEVKVVNFYAAQNPTTPSGYSFVSRPSLQSLVNLPGQTIRGIYYQQGWLNDNLIIVADDKLFRVDSSTGIHTLVGTIPGLSECKFSASFYHLAILSDGRLYLFDGATITSVNIPDNQLVSDITSLNNYIILSIQNTNKFFWVVPGNDFIDPLDFASAESNPDYLVSVKSTSDELWFLGNNTTEVWAPSGQADAPFIRITGRVYNTGCFNNQSVSSAMKESSPAIIWVSEAREVVIAQGIISKISNDFVEEVLRNSSYYYGWYFRRNRNDFYVLTTDIYTLVYDITLDTWYHWNTYLKPNWDASKGVQVGDKVFVCNLMRKAEISVLAEAAKDGTTDWIVCEITGTVFNTTRNPVNCAFLDVSANSGFAGSYLADPIVEMRWSDDQGANWSNYMQTTLGSRGSTKSQVSFRSLGQIKQPGRMFEFRFSGVDNFRLDYVNMNGD